jgi:tRNA(Ile)-lysidine synthase
MRPKNGYVVRPLLDVPRTDIEAFLKAEGQAYRTDSTNTDTIYRRNKIRHELLPLLRELNPSIEKTLAATMARLKEAEAIVAQRAGKDSSDRLPLAELQASPATQTLVFDFLSPYGFTPSQCRQIASNCTQRVGTLYASASHLCVRDRDALVVGIKPPTISSFEIPKDAHECILPNGARLRLNYCKRDALLEFPKAANVVCLDRNRMHFPLMVRSPREGDRFIPYGMKGSQLLSDYLTNKKRNRIEKLATLLLCDAEGPLWVINERPDQRAAISETTQDVVILEFITGS